MMKKKDSYVNFLLHGVPVLALFAAGCGNSPVPEQPGRRPVVFVEVEVARRSTIASSISATGTIAAKNEIKIIAQTEGKITDLSVEEGDHVRSGQVLVKLDASVLAAQTKEAEANMKDAESNLARAERLFQTRLVSDQEYEQSKTRYSVAKAKYDYQRALLNYTVITSPITGVITYRGARQGDIAVPRQLLLTVSDPTNLVMEINISELEVPKIHVGDSVRVTVDMYPREEFSGRIRRIFPSSDPVSRLVRVEVQLQSVNPRLFPGLFARAELTTSLNRNALVVSNDAIITSSAGQTGAFVVLDSVVQHRVVKIGMRDAALSEIVEGLSQGEKVVVVGQNNLNDGMQVRVTRER